MWVVIPDLLSRALLITSSSLSSSRRTSLRLPQVLDIVRCCRTIVLTCTGAGYPVQLRLQPLYDHSYYFISTFMRDHVDFHARALGLRPKL